MQAPTFGGPWTKRKLEVVGRYLDVYAKALKNQPSSKTPFRRLYVDAFAGTGDRANKRLEAQRLLDLPEFDAVTKGSARLALEVEPPFDEFILVEKAARRASELTELVHDHRDRRITILNEDANDAIQRICHTTDWRSTRGVVFLDPFGLQVSWNSLLAISRTAALDLWALFPTGMGLNRLLTRSGMIRPEWQRTLNRFLGTEDWRGEFYRVDEDTDLFGEATTRNVKDANAEKLEQFVLKRLESIFPVVMKPGVPLTNSKGQSMYLLCFASANPSPRVKALALKLARWAAKT